MEVHSLKTTMYLSLKATTIRLLSWFPIWEMANLKRRVSFCPGINKSHLSLTFVIAVADIISWRDCWQIDPVIKFKSATQISPFQASCDRNLTALRDDLATDLFELEEEYYSSSYKWLQYTHGRRMFDPKRKVRNGFQVLPKSHQRLKYNLYGTCCLYSCSFLSWLQQELQSI